MCCKLPRFMSNGSNASSVTRGQNETFMLSREVIAYRMSCTPTEEIPLQRAMTKTRNSEENFASWVSTRSVSWLQPEMSSSSRHKRPFKGENNDMSWWKAASVKLLQSSTRRTCGFKRGGKKMLEQIQADMIVRRMSRIHTLSEGDACKAARNTMLFTCVHCPRSSDVSWWQWNRACLMTDFLK